MRIALRLVLGFCILVNAVHLFGQCPPPGFPQTTSSCPTANLVCDLNQYCNLINNSNVTQNFPGCPNNVLNNDEWFAFYAATTAISIQITPTGCAPGTNGSLGMQGAIYGACGGSSAASWQIMDTQCPCLTTPFTLSATNFVVGQIYYVVFDGCSGSVCNYSVAVTVGSTQAPPPPMPALPSGPATICGNGSNYTYTIPVVPFASGYTWTIDPPGVVTPNAAGTSVTVSFPPGTSGNYNLCVNGFNGCNAGPIRCRPIIVRSPPTATLSGSGTICTGGAPVPLTVNFTGDPSWTFTYAINGVNQPPVTTSTNPYTINATQPGNYTLVAVSNNAGVTCTGTVSGSATVASLSTTASLQAVPATCGQANGGLNLTVGGTAPGPHTYIWSNGSTDQNLTNVTGPQIYTVTVTSPAGCTATAQSSVPNNNIPISITGTTTPNTTCQPPGNGSLNVTINPATATFVWSNGASSLSQTDLAAGTYTITATVGVSCTQTQSFTIANQVNSPTASLSTTGSTCNLENGAVNLTVTGGVSPYTYLWSNGATDPNLVMVPAGPYTVTVTGDNGCTTSVSGTVANSNPPITVTGVVTNNTTCLPTGNGAINITVSPAGTYTYNWNTSSTDEDQTNLSPGTYTVTVTGNGTCTGSASFNVGNTPITPSANLTAVGTTCNLENGSVNLTVTGGTPPYSYLWTNGSTDPNLTMIAAGPYGVTVTDAQGCTTATTTNVNNTNPPINVTGVVTPNTICGPTGNGAINITVSPAGTYTYNWTTPSSDEDQSGLSPGIYTVTVTGNGSCTGSASFNILNQPNNPTVSITATGTTCELSNGSVNTTVTGGVSPFTYLWSDGSTTQNLTNIPAGAYTVTVTGTNGCTATASANVNNVNPPINVTGVTTPNTTCLATGNGAINITVSPAGTYTYNWSNSSTAEDQTNLSPGTYVVTVTGQGACTGSASFTVADNPAVPTANLTAVNALCGEPTGSVNLTVTGGVTPYTYQWSNGATTQNISNLPPGNYGVVVTGANACTTTANINVNDNTPNININGNATPNTTCTGGNGSISITITPANPNYTILWSNGSGNTNLTSLVGGSYTVTVTLGATCSQQATFNVPDNPNLPNINGTATDATCELANGSITVTPGAGPTPYTYQWSNGSSSQSINNVPPGNYSVIVTGANGCVQIYDYSISNNNPPILVSGSVVPNTSCANPNGRITLNVQPAGTYTYSWSSGQGTANITGMPAGTYTVTVFGQGTCQQVEVFTIDDNISLPVINTNFTNPTCGLANGRIQITMSGGVSPYTYAWTGASGNNILNNLPAGNYTVTVTDARGCTTTTNFVLVNEQIDITLGFDVFGVTNCTPPNGTILLNLSPPGMSVQWGHTSSTATSFTNLAVGTYYVTVSAGGTCTSSTSIFVEDFTELPTITLTPTAATCGANNGSITSSVQFGQTPYTYRWSNGATTPNLTNIAPGTYSITVTTASGCSDVAFTTIINNNTNFSITGTTTPNTSCVANNGAINVSVSPPSANYTYTWAPGGQNTASLANLAPGTYTLTVSEGVSCTAVRSFTVTNDATTPNLTGTTTAASCGLANGSVDITASGAQTPFTYAWTPAASTEDLSNVPAGNYTVTVTNAGGCTTSATFAVGANNPTIDITGTATNNTSCSNPNGAIQVVASPAGAYTYSWSNGSTNANLTGLIAGIYTVTVSAGGNCSATSAFQIANATSPPVLTSTVVAAICGNPTGAIDLTVTGPNSPFTYNWTSAALPGPVNTEDLNGIGPGLYYVTVTDATGCTALADYSVANNASTFSLSGNVTDYSNCATINGAIDLTVTPPGTYTYTWSDGPTTQDRTGLIAGIYTVSVTQTGTCTASITFDVNDLRTQPVVTFTSDPDICGTRSGAISTTVLNAANPVTYAWNPAATTQNLTNLPAGTYALTVTDANQCTATATQVVNAQSVPFSLTGATSPNTSCAAPNGAVAITMSPATAPSPFTYQFLWSNNSTSQSLTGLNSGSYALTVTVGSTCTNSASFTIANQSGAPNLNATTNSALCGAASGSVDLTITDGLSPYTILWSNAASTEDLTNLTPGTYAVTVTDANSCAANGSWTVQNQTFLPAIAGATIPNTSCAAPNGSAQVTVTPANPGTGLSYTYLWSNSGNGASVNNLGSGTYTVTVSAGTGCTNSAQVTVANQSGAPDLSGSTSATVCGNSGGSINLNVTGGQTPYTYAWSNGTSAEDPANLVAGNYTVTVTDGNSCSTTASFTVGNTALNFLASGTPVGNTSCLSPNGSISATANPPLPVGSGLSYSYAWSTGATSANINNLASGTYTVTVSAGTGCTATAVVVVPNNAGAPDLSASSNPALCGNAGGSLNLTITGGLQPYSALWSNGSNLEDPVGLVPGTYTVTVTDGNACTVSASFSVTTTTFSPTVNATPTASTSCSAPNGAISINVNPANPGVGLVYSYQWSTGTTTQNQTNLPAGTYTVTVSTGQGCTGTLSVNVQSQLDLPVLTAAPGAAFCGDASGSINVTAASGLPPYSFSWSTGAVTEDVQGLASGNYTVTVTDANGCQQSATFTVPENTITPVIQAATQPNTSCPTPNGALSITVSPAATYTYTWSNGQSGTVLNNLVAGPYQVTVSAGGSCTASQTVIVPDASGAPTITGAVVNNLCFGDNLGSITLSLTGGQSPFSYVWSQANLGNTANPTGLASGAYAVTVTDVMGCSSIADFIIGGPGSAITVQCFQTQQISAPGATDGKGRINISGGTAPYRIEWSPGGGVQLNFAGGAFNLDNLAEGLYTTTVTDANGCTSICQFPISQQGCETALGTLGSAPISVCGPTCLTVSYNAVGQFLDPDDVLQFILFTGASPATGTEIARSNTPSFCFNPTTMQYGANYFVAVAAGNNLGNGNVDLNHYCTVISAGTPVQWKPKPVATIAPVSPLNCIVRQVTLTGSSSLPLATFNWSSQNGIIVGVPTAAVIQAANAGAYSLVVRVDGCADTTTIQVADVSNNPKATILAQPGDLLDCDIDTIQLVGVIEGTIAPQLVWTVNQQTISNGSSITVANPGNYQLVLLDTITRCSDTAQITIQTNQNFPLLFAPNPDTLTCAVTAVTLQGSSPFPGILFRWARLVGADTIVVSNSSTAQVGQPGTYIFIGTDPGSGCKNSLSVNVQADIIPPTANAGTDLFIDCYGDELNLDGTASSGSGTLLYAWFTTDGNIVNGQNTAQPLVNDFGNYTLVVTQTYNGCTDSDDVQLQPLPITANAEISQPVCEGDKGVIRVVDVSGAPPVRYSIDGGSLWSNTGLFTGLAVGNYTIQMIDAQGCSGELNATVLPAPPFVLDLNSIAVVQLGDSYQMAPILNVPGNALALIQWTPDTFLTCNNCLNPVVVLPTQSTRYTLLVRDSAGCERSAPIIIKVEKDLVLEVPNVFTPGTQFNGVLHPFADTRELKEIDLMRIYSRWGELVFEQRKFPPNDPTYGWDGTHKGRPLNPGVFVWYVEATFIDGTKRFFKGDVTITR